jgi:peptide/nickel transport system permease protein
MPSTDDPPAFATVDWDDLDGRTAVSLRSKLLVLGAAAVAVLFAYDRYVAHVYLVFDWTVGPLEWLFLLSVVVFGSQVLVPLVRRPRLAARVWRRFRRGTGAVAGLAFLSVLFVGGVVGPVLWPLDIHPLFAEQPPMFLPVGSESVTECAGFVANDWCFGAPRFPLGTDHLGRGVLAYTLAGARTALYVAFIVGLLVVPLATAVGLLAGYRGGLADDLLMAGVDMQQTLPAIVLYLVLVSVFTRSIWLLVVSFGVFSWGTVARLVRNEARQRATDGYVLAAKGMGASGPDVVRRHLLPNVSNTVVTALAHLVPVLILTEAGIAFLGYGSADADSWGRIIFYGLEPEYAPVWEMWWVATPAVVALAGLVVSCKLVGDALRDALDPRGER